MCDLLSDVLGPVSMPLVLSVIIMAGAAIRARRNAR